MFKPTPIAGTKHEVFDQVGRLLLEFLMRHSKVCCRKRVTRRQLDDLSIISLALASRCVKKSVCSD